MNADALLRELTRRGVRLALRGERLHVEAAEGVLSDADLAAMRQLKPELVALLQSAEPQLDGERGLAAAWRGAARELGELAGHPSLTFAAGHGVAPGAAMWALFVTRASIADLCLVVEALRDRLATAPRPEDLQ